MLIKALQLIKTNRRAQTGFTLVEVIVATMVIVVGILATVAAANVSVRASDDNERKTVATNLAREGVELVRNMRDTNWQSYVEDHRIKASDPAYQPRDRDDWDCAPLDQAGALSQPFTCGDINGELHLSQYPISQKLHATVNFVAGQPNSSPYLKPVASGQTNPKNPEYRLCQRSAVPRVYVSEATAGGCTNREGYYRHVTIESRAGDAGSKSIYARSTVTWDDRKAEDIVVETYLTSWRNF